MHAYIHTHASLDVLSVRVSNPFEACIYMPCMPCTQSNAKIQVYHEDTGSYGIKFSNTRLQHRFFVALCRLGNKCTLRAQQRTFLF